MSAEINAIISLAASKGGFSVSQSIAKTSDMSGDAMMTAVQTIGTDAEAVSVGDITGQAKIMIANMEGTALHAVGTGVISVALDAEVSAKIFSILNPGEALYIPAATVTLYVKSTAAATQMAVVAVEP
jgi:hypothetical protein